MGTFTVKKVGGYNKPPPPTPLPDPSIFPSKKLLQGPWGNREVWVSVPLPDKLAFTVPLTPKVYSESVGQTGKPEAFGSHMHKYLLYEIEHAFGIKCEKKEKNGQPYQLHLGERGSTVSIFRYHNSFKLECNPRKLGPAGFEKLALVLGGLFNLNAMAKSSKLKRVDAAVDLVGVDVTELVACHVDGGTRAIFCGPDGKLGSLYLNWKSGSSSAMRTILYDRQALKLGEGKASTFGDTPIARVEVVTANIDEPKWTIFKLLTLPDRFLKTRVGFWRSQVDKHDWVPSYLAFRRALSPKGAAEMVGSAANADFLRKMEVLETVPKPDFVVKAANWTDWHKGLEITGVKHFLDLCDQCAPPPPDPKYAVIS